MTSVSQEHATTAPVCYRHPDRHTLLRCSRCDRPICASCSIDATVGQRCPECIRAEGPQKIIPKRQVLTRSGGAPATKIFIGLAVVFFLATEIGGMGPRLFEALAQVNGLVGLGEWWRIFTPVLLHAGIMHLLFNMWALWVLGPQIERGVGTWPFVGVYLASAGVGGAFAYIFGSPADIAVGASGAIFGLFGATTVYFVRYRENFGSRGRAILQNMLFVIGVNLVFGFSMPGIDNYAHIGGLVGGALAAYGLLPVYRRPQLTVLGGDQALEVESRPAVEAMWIIIYAVVIWASFRAASGGLGAIF